MHELTTAYFYKQYPNQIRLSAIITCYPHPVGAALAIFYYYGEQKAVTSFVIT